MSEKRNGSLPYWIFVVLFQISFGFYSYQTVFLQDNGFTATQIGYANAAIFVCAMPFTMFVGVLSDRLGTVKRVLVPLLIAAGVTYALFPLVSSGMAGYVPVMILLSAVSGMLRESGYSLTDNITVRGCVEKGFNYGLIRGSGSLSYALATLSCIFFVPVVGVRVTFWLMGLCMIPTLICLRRVPDPAASAEHHSFKLSELKELLRMYPLAIFFIFLFCYHFATRTVSDFIVVFMGKVGLNTDRYGLINCYRASLEFPALFLMIYLRKKFPLKWICASAALLRIAECLLTPTLGVSMGGLMAVQTLSGLANGIIIGTAANYVNSLAPRNLQASAAAMTTVISSVSGLLGNLVGGVLFDSMELRELYTLVAGMYLFGLAFFVLASRLGRKKVENF